MTMRLFILILFIITNQQIFASDVNSLNSKEQACYATAMIGYDYVINSRVGLPIERALSTVTVNVEADNVNDTYKFQLHTVVMNAYQWQGEPHTYAAKVMYNCAFSQALKSNSL